MYWEKIHSFQRSATADRACTWFIIRSSPHEMGFQVFSGHVIIFCPMVSELQNSSQSGFRRLLLDSKEMILKRVTPTIKYVLGPICTVLRTCLVVSSQCTSYTPPETILRVEHHRVILRAQRICKHQRLNTISWVSHMISKRDTFASSREFAFPRFIQFPSVHPP